MLALVPVRTNPETVTDFPFATPAVVNEPDRAEQETPTSAASAASTPLNVTVPQVIVALVPPSYSLFDAVTPPEIVMVLRDTVIVRSTSGAGLYVPSPDWLAVMVHVPTLTIVSVVPDTVHTSEVVLANATVSPDGVAVAESVIGVAPYV